MIAVNRLAGLCLILTGFPILIHAQANDAEQEDRISELEKAEGQDPERLAAIVELQAEKPDVNLLHHETLSLLPCLTTAQTEALLAHRSRHGPILCVEELAAVTGFDPVTIDCMMRHVEFPERFTMPDQLESDFARHLSLEVTGNINRKVIPEENAGNAVTTNGDAYRSALRIRMAENSGLKAGINLEKDAYEPWWSERGTDHTGWYLDYAPSKKHIRLIVGDYSPGIGQGVLFGRNSFGGTGGDVTGLVRVSAGIRPHSAMSENGYLKGIAVDYRMKKFELIGFGSYLKTDGRITWSDDSLTKYFNEDRSGYHRTLSEATYAATGHTVVFGGRIGFEQGGMTAGITACNLHNAWPAPPADEPYAYFRKQEKEQSVFSVDYRRVGGQTLLFGETAMDSKGSSSTCTGVLLHPDRNVAAGLLFRHRGRGFSFPFANPTGFATEGAGETGLLTLFNIRLDDRFALQLSFDRYSVAWLGYDRNSLSRGGSETARLLITKGKSSEAVLQLRFIHATISTDTDERMEGSIAGSSMQFRAQVIHRPGFGVQFKTRLETRWDRLQSQTPPSVLAFHEIKSRFRQLPVTALIRLSIFRTTGYADAIYSQESMPLYQFGSTMNYGTGWRNYLMLKIDLSRSLDLWMRICHTKLFDRRMEDAFSGGDGTASLESNLQLRWRLH